MTDTINVRDHSKPCGHGRFVPLDEYDWSDGSINQEGFWECTLDECPGGKEILLRRPTKNEVNMPGVWVDMTGWVEVDSHAM